MRMLAPPRLTIRRCMSGDRHSDIRGECQCATAGFLFTNCGIYVGSLVMDALGRRQNSQSRAVSSSLGIVYFRVAPGGTQGGAAPT